MLPASARIRAKLRVVDADQSHAGAAHRLGDPGEHLAARGDRDDVDVGGALTVDGGDHLPVEDRAVQRHRDVVLGREADGRLELVAVLDPRQADRAHRDLLVRDPDPHLARELVLGKQRLDRVAEGVGVRDLAVPDRTRGQRGDAVPSHADRAVDAHLGRGDAPGIESRPTTPWERPIGCVSGFFFLDRAIMGRGGAGGPPGAQSAQTAPDLSPEWR